MYTSSGSASASLGRAASFLTFIRFSFDAASPKRTIRESFSYTFFFGAGATGVLGAEVEGAGVDGELVDSCFGVAGGGVFLTVLTFLTALCFFFAAAGVNGSLRTPSTRRRRERSSAEALATTGSASASSAFADCSAGALAGCSGGVTG